MHASLGKCSPQRRVRVHGRGRGISTAGKRRGGPMQLGIAMIARPPADQQPGSGLRWLTDFGTLAEKLGFAGIWSTDSMGRGSHTLDPVVTLSALHAGTSRIELGTGVLQVPLRRPG